MVDQIISALEKPISRVRLESYRGGGSDLDMVVNYFHNLELSEAFYPSLQAFEIAFRNSLHTVLSDHFDSPYWFDHPGFLTSRQAKSVEDVRRQLRKDRRPRSYVADDIVSRLSFGFWHGMFNKPFEARLWRPNQFALIDVVWPYIPKRHRNRQDIWNRVDRIRIVRNRVMHYEPIWSRRNLRSDHEMVLQAIAWISPDMEATIAMCDRFLAVLSGGKASVEQRIHAEIHHKYSTD